MKAALIGGNGYNLWSDPLSWDGSTQPQSSDGLHVTLNSSSVENLGTVSDPFVTNDVISASLTRPDLTITGFLSAHDLSGVNVYVQGAGSGIDVRHDADSTSFFINSGSAEIEHGVAASDSFLFLRTFGSYHINANNATLILDRPPGNSLDNFILLPTAYPNPTYPPDSNPLPFSLKIELGKINFDNADILPGSGGVSTLELKEGNTTVYTMTNVRGGGPVTGPYSGTVSVGVDPNTGYDFVSYSHA